jgi:hypothetical protein
LSSEREWPGGFAKTGLSAHRALCAALPLRWDESECTTEHFAAESRANALAASDGEWYAINTAQMPIDLHLPCVVM